MKFSYEQVKPFYDYLIINDNGWAGIREDAPEEVKKAYKEFQKMYKSKRNIAIKED